MNSRQLLGPESQQGNDCPLCSGPKKTEDFTGETDRYQITLSEAEYEGELFPTVLFSKFTMKEFHCASVLVVDLGNKLNNVLSGSKSAAV